LISGNQKPEARQGLEQKILIVLIFLEIKKSKFSAHDGGRGCRPPNAPEIEMPPTRRALFAGGAVTHARAQGETLAPLDQVEMPEAVCGCRALMRRQAARHVADPIAPNASCRRCESVLAPRRDCHRRLSACLVNHRPQRAAFESDTGR
jgi:hypothetical protein